MRPSEMLRRAKWLFENSGLDKMEVFHKGRLGHELDGNIELRIRLKRLVRKCGWDFDHAITFAEKEEEK